MDNYPKQPVEALCIRTVRAKGDPTKRAISDVDIRRRNPLAAL
ncbi:MULTISPECIES: hypothetical protein [unclassified Burkholderia]|nr:MULTISPECIES: hypothetical protein [unclassified Burkholderia]